MKHTYEYGIIGNCAFLALIGKDTNVSWMCWPRFDSSFVFGGLLDSEKGGNYSILPSSEDFQSRQYYIENTNILCTEVTCSDGSYRVTDFAPRFLQYERYYKPLMLVRKVEPLSGTPRVKAVCQPVGDYGKAKPEGFRGSNHIEYLGLEKSLRLTTNISLSYVEGGEYFVLNEPKYLVLTYGVPLEAPLERTIDEFLQNTIRYWRNWVKSTSIGKFYQKEVIRSALVLKIHQYEDTGAIIASATTSLPESPGSGRNWDYRYCWLRDTYYTLEAFNNIGHFEEVEKYFHFIANVSAGSQSRYQPLYTLEGGRSIIEKELPLEGYKGNKPVRVGNQAYEHIQNDVYGQVMIALLPLYVDRRFIGAERVRSRELIVSILDKINKTMDEPDAGLWEFRNFSQFHCYTFLFHWAGSCAAIKMAEHFQDEDVLKRAEKLKKSSIRRIESCYDPQRQVYSQALGSQNLDASTMQLIIMHYLDPNSDKAKKHLQNLEKELMSEHGLFFRYKHPDDFGLPKSTFLICAFWYVEALSCVGRLKEAIEVFEKLLTYANSLGLLSEDVSPKDGSQWGNFPQAYSHVGLVNAAYRISKKMDYPGFF
ncbi:glycoside hydrolase family 15 protein [Xanthovirga aplysinae]|uniref:glycoside hydrolase family 15 protein n=1 Tax=Xanthovirga aplysinae TaxID=2529853 RepID=UPI0012BB6EFC|nr:glycoside hydrolase family 15 protein [Xanthovirga aplysinae]MTI30465.1 glycoside hydrolase family 15 protein [Xanthovirga aplysinae]